MEIFMNTLLVTKTRNNYNDRLRDRINCGMSDSGILHNIKNDVDLMLNEITETVCVDTQKKVHRHKIVYCDSFQVIDFYFALFAYLYFLFFLNEHVVPVNSK